MGFPARLLGEGEVVVLHCRTHGKALVLPATILVVAAGLAGAGWGAVPDGRFAWLRWVVVAFAVLAVLIWSVVPFARWWTTTYTLTTERVISRTGVVNRTGRDIPLARVNDVAFQQSIWDRFFGCGSLVVSASGEASSETLRDVPSVAAVQLTMSELVRDAHGWSRTPRHRVAHQHQEGTATTELPAIGEPDAGRSGTEAPGAGPPPDRSLPSPPPDRSLPSPPPGQSPASAGSADRTDADEAG